MRSYDEEQEEKRKVSEKVVRSFEMMLEVLAEKGEGHPWDHKDHPKNPNKPIPLPKVI